MARAGGMAAVSIPAGAALTAGGRHEPRARRLPAALIGAVIACLATLALATPLAPTSSRTHPAHRGLASLPITLTPIASASIGASERSFWPVRRGASLVTHGGGIHGTFTSSGARLRVAKGTVALSLAGVGHGQRLDPVPAVGPTGAANQVLYRHGSITELYRNGPYGVEQGFTVSQGPQAGTGPLVLALRLGGSLVAEQVGSQVLFRTQRGGVTTLRYGQLSALDATGRRLPAHMQLRNGTLELRINDSNAHYPLRVDPFVQQGEKLTGSGEIGASRFGNSVALSADGNTALIGGPADNGGISGGGFGGVGAAWVFTRSGSTWTQQGPKLTPSGESGEGSFGFSVALSSDGNTALIGGPGDNKGVGAAWVFTRSGSSWTQQGEKLTGSGEIGASRFGNSVALSGDGNTALIGGGAAWVFTRSGSAWTQQGPKLTPSGEGSFGSSVALSSDGNTALIGGGGDAAWVFTRSGSSWTQQGEKLTGGGESGFAGFGVSVALSADGNTALIGGHFDNKSTGAAWVFTRSGSTWTQQGPKLTGSGEAESGFFGIGVALSADGNTALIVSSTFFTVGAAWTFTRSGSTWTQQGEKFTGSGEEFSTFGFSVALSSDGNTALIGSGADIPFVGAAWVFTNVGAPAATTTSTSLSGGGQSGTSITVPEGTAVTDTATLSGENAATATGKVTYNVYSDKECKSLVASAGEVEVTGGKVPPSSAQTLPPDPYYWTASYSGDGSNQPSSSKCGVETLTVEAGPPPTTTSTSLSGAGRSGPRITVPEGTAVTDQATLSGTNIGTATGKVSYNVYSDPECNNLVASAEASVVGGTASASNPQTLPAGTYYWRASYSGDTLNKPSSSECGSEVLTVEGASITLRPTFARGVTGSGHTVVAQVKVAQGNPQPGVAVGFKITEGPNAGTTGSATSNASGQASFTYTSSAAGLDEIVAEFTDGSGQRHTSNIVRQEWVTPSPIEKCNGLDDNGNGVVDEGFPDADRDGIADCVDEDQDNDGIGNGVDNCPQVANPDQADSNHNGIGDACDPGTAPIDNPPSPVDIETDGQFGPPSGEWTTIKPASFLGGDSLVYSAVEGQDIYLMYDYRRNTVPLSVGQTVGPISFQVGSGSFFDVFITQGGPNTEFGPNPPSSAGGAGDTVQVFLNGEPFDNSVGCVKGAVDHNSTSPNFLSFGPHNLVELEVRLRAFGGCYSDEPAFWSATLPSVTSLAPTGALAPAALAAETPENVQASSAFFKVDPDGTTHVTPLSPPVAPTTISTSLSGGGQSGERITVPEGTAVSDDATLSGEHAANASGTVEYKVYADEKCAKEVASAGTVSTEGQSVPESNAVTLAPGTYYWQASYSGDALNEPARSKCGEEQLTVIRGVSAPRLAKRALLSALEALVPSGAREADRRIAEAIRDVKRSLDPKLWVDDSHLSAKKGENVFEQEEAAVEQLRNIKRQAAGAVAGLIAQLVEVDRTLAQIAIEGATDPKAIAKANKELEKAAKELKKGRPSDAIEHYKQAWKAATN
jgi:hypothetical protein